MKECPDRKKTKDNTDKGKGAKSEQKREVVRREAVRKLDGAETTGEALAVYESGPSKWDSMMGCL